MTQRSLFTAATVAALVLGGSLVAAQVKPVKPISPGGTTIPVKDPKVSIRQPVAPGTDADGDGRVAEVAGGDDCDDKDRNRFPGNPEVCDHQGHDEDCNSQTVGDRDTDADGAVDCACSNPGQGGRVTAPQCDCDDHRADKHYGLAESCDNEDNDCDGAIDETTGILMFRDADGDGFGDARARVRSCDIKAGISALGNDCDDKDASKTPLRGCP